MHSILDDSRGRLQAIYSCGILGQTQSTIAMEILGLPPITGLWQMRTLDLQSAGRPLRPPFPASQGRGFRQHNHLLFLHPGTHDPVPPFPVQRFPNLRLQGEEASILQPAVMSAARSRTARTQQLMRLAEQRRQPEGIPPTL